ncbi:MAG: bifunctional glutamate N-acetyltransferase/amino-acid acetyltransferase ArgJ [Actinomycetota bacterium]
MSVTFPRGFRAAGVAAGFKASGRPDLGLLMAEAPATAAAAFTTSALPAAPVILSRRHLADGTARAVAVNSGQANAGTGAHGITDAEETASIVAEAVGCDVREVVICSTGVIGPRVPLDRLRAAIPPTVRSLAVDGGPAFAEAILTTDPRPKEATASAGPYRIGGCAKGAGMIAPRLAPLATMLAFLTTDAPVSRPALGRIVAERVVPVWNGVVVDDCQSTNDTVLLLASGAAGGDVIDGGREEAALGEAVEGVCRELAHRMVADAEGASTVLVVQVEGARSADDARGVGLAVAGSSLVKTAVFGRDPNPGRLLQAAGDAGVALDPAALNVSLGAVPVVDGGVVLPVDERVRSALKEAEVVIRLDLGAGSASATAFGCDLGYEYVRINAEYST